MKKKGIIVAVCLILVGLFAVNGTLAQGIEGLFRTIFGTNEAEVDTTQLDVELVYQKHVVDNAGNVSFETVTDLPMLYPAHYPENYTWTTKSVPIGNDVYQLWDDKAVTGVVDKFVSVRNVAEKAAFVRIYIAVKNDATAQEYLKVNIGLSNAGDDKYITAVHQNDITIGGAAYKLYAFDYKEKLSPNAVTPPITLQVAVDKRANNAELAALGNEFLQIHALAIESDAFANYDENGNLINENNPNPGTPMSPTTALEMAIGDLDTHNPYPAIIK